MSGFSAVFQQESNEAWLNELVGGIIDPSHLTQHGRSRSDDVNAVGSDLEHQQSLGDNRRSVSSSPGWKNFSRLSWHTRSPSSAHTRTASDNDRRVLLLNPYRQESQSACPSTTRSSWHSTDSKAVPLSPRTSEMKLDEQRATINMRSFPPRTSSLSSDARTRSSYGRPQSQNLKPISELPTDLTNADSMSSDVSLVGDEKCIFAPHPGVRPLADREVLGQAAGPSEDDADHQYPGPLSLTLIIIGICLSVFIISVDRNIVTTAIPDITRTFQSYSDTGWYGSAYFLTASAFQPLYGRVYMSFDVRWTFVVALSIFELGSVLGGIAPSSDVLILSRAVQGLGSAGILTGSFVVATHSVRLQHRPVLFAFVGILYGVGALCGPLLGGTLTDLLDWRWIFWINLPIGAVTFVSVFFLFKPRNTATSSKMPPWIERIINLDLVGNAIILGACVQLFLALELSQTRGNWNNAPCIGLLSGFGATTLIFIAWLLYKGDKALIPPRIIKQRTVAASCGAAFFIYGTLLLHAFYLPIWFQAIKNTSALGSGVNMIPYMLTNALFSLLAGVFVSKNGLFAPPAIIGCAIGTIGSGLLATLEPNSSLGHWFGFEVLISAGLGMAIQQGFSAVQTALPLGEVPIGTAAVVAAQSLGGAVFVSVGNAVLQDHLLNQTNQQTIPGVDLRAVFRMGATNFRNFVPQDQIAAVVQLYNDSLQGVFISAVPLCGCAFLCSLCMEWRSVKKSQI